MHLFAVDYNAFGRYVDSIDNAVFLDAKQNIILQLVDRRVIAVGRFFVQLRNYARNTVSVLYDCRALLINR